MSFLLRQRLKRLRLPFSPSHRSARPASVRFVERRSKKFITWLVWSSLFNLGTALTPTLFFETFSILPILRDMSDPLFARALNIFLAPLAVILFWVRSRWIMLLLAYITRIMASKPSSCKLFLPRSTWTISRFTASMLAISCAADYPREKPCRISFLFTHFESQ